ncbi:MAG: carbamoyltransferase HypF [Chromatiales bacterium]|jgi:hydrogenase maturation protein HypF
MPQSADSSAGMHPVTLLRIRGIVQGVGFRPAVWRIARDLDLHGEVSNDGDGVLIRLAPPGKCDAFVQQLRAEIPPLARIDAIEISEEESPQQYDSFSIIASRSDTARTGVPPDAATCPACLAEIRDPADRRHRYPFTNCTHCGPRLSIIHGIPYDREQTSMAAFTMCPSCQGEYDSPADRRFHAQPNACPACGPRAWLEDRDGRHIETDDPVATASELLSRGNILALRGIGGFHLAADATSQNAVATLRERKRRQAKPFALMARDMDVIRRYCDVNEQEAALLRSTTAPIVLLRRKAEASPLPETIAPGQSLLGFMLPYSPLHHLLLESFETPLVMTSGNLSDEPQAIANADARQRLGSIEDYLLLHDREIVNRVDDSVVRVINGRERILRRARGYAPASLPLPAGFGKTPAILALGGELKNSFCLVHHGEAILSQHMGDLEDFSTFGDYLKNLDLYARLYRHEPDIIAIDAHPEYLSSKHGRELAARNSRQLQEIQHHHAHIASCLAENGHARDAGPVIGVALDGLGYGRDGTIWGGEFLVADYLDARRIGCLTPVPMPGGTMAILEPWRNTFAQLQLLEDWTLLRETYAGLELIRHLDNLPTAVLSAMMAKGINSPLTSSAGRLFDAVAAAAGVCRDRIQYEGQAAIEFEALVDSNRLATTRGYDFSISGGEFARIDPAPMWRQLLKDLQQGQETAIISERFHKGLAAAISRMVCHLASQQQIETIALSGGVFQNATLLTLVERSLQKQGLRVLAHSRIPANDGGLALGQAMIAAAHAIKHEDQD